MLTITVHFDLSMMKAENPGSNKMSANPKIENLFIKDIRRKINGVIKVDQDDDDSVYTELEEYASVFG